MFSLPIWTVGFLCIIIFFSAMHLFFAIDGFYIPKRPPLLFHIHYRNVSLYKMFVVVFSRKEIIFCGFLFNILHRVGCILVVCTLVRQPASGRWQSRYETKVICVKFSALFALEVAAKFFNVAATLHDPMLFYSVRRFSQAVFCPNFDRSVRSY